MDLSHLLGTKGPTSSDPVIDMRNSIRDICQASRD